MASNKIALLFSAVQGNGELAVEAAPATGFVEIHPNGGTSTVHLALRMLPEHAERIVEALYSGNATVLVETVASVVQSKSEAASPTLPA
jgi:hypothetical protein